jgi:hypothetical protein
MLLGSLESMVPFFTRKVDHPSRTGLVPLLPGQRSKYWDTGDLKNIIKYHKNPFIVDLPIRNGDFPIVLLVYQRVIQYPIKYPKKNKPPRKKWC